MDSDREVKRKLRKSHGRNAIKTAATIAKLLGAEGYSDYAHNCVENYWKNRIMDLRRQRSVERIEKAMSRIMADKTAEERLVIGKFVSLRAKQSMDAGLRIGLQAAFFGLRNGRVIDASNGGERDEQG